MNIAESLKFFIESKKIEGISATMIAKQLNISNKTLSNYISGDAYIPLKHLNKLSNIFNVSIDYILGINKEIQYSENKIVNILDSKKIGNNLLKFRKELNLNQEQFAKKIGTNKSVVSRYENGTNLILTINIYIIATTYKISADYLLGKIDSPKYLE